MSQAINKPERAAALSMLGSSAVVAINAPVLKRTTLAGVKSANPSGPGGIASQVAATEVAA